MTEDTITAADEADARDVIDEAKQDAAHELAPYRKQPAPADCEECRGHVQPGTMCPNCGMSRANETAAIFLQATDLPYYPPRLDCCEHAAVEVMLDPDGRSPLSIIVSHNHSASCDVWRYI